MEENTGTDLWHQVRIDDYLYYKGMKSVIGRALWQIQMPGQR